MTDAKAVRIGAVKAHKLDVDSLLENRYFENMMDREKYDLTKEPARPGTDRTHVWGRCDAVCRRRSDRTLVAGGNASRRLCVSDGNENVFCTTACTASCSAPFRTCCSTVTTFKVSRN